MIQGIEQFPDLVDKVREELYNDENDADVFALVDLFAFDRARARRESPERAHVEFSAKILCVLLDPLKPPTYKNVADERRRGFKGVATSRNSQVHFVRSIRDYAHRLSTTREAYTAGFDKLFDEVELDPARIKEPAYMV